MDGPWPRRNRQFFGKMQKFGTLDLTVASPRSIFCHERFGGCLRQTIEKIAPRRENPQ
jgi:hypothetical protein